jgi:uncharacterized protein YkwD
MLANFIVGIGLLGGLAGSAASDAGARLQTEQQNMIVRVTAARVVHVNAAAMASLVSAFRREHGLGPVTVDPTLTHLAHEQARNMAAYNMIGHDVGRSFSERRRGIRARVVVENLGAAYGSVAEAFAGWRDSPSHRANMLDPDMTRLGIAAAPTSDSYYRVFWALMMASR